MVREEKPYQGLDSAVLSNVPKEHTATVSDALDRRLKCLVLTLPPEITSEIFVHSLPRQITPMLNHAPIVFTRVCRAWRIIAMSTPELWDSVFMAPAKDDESMVTYIDMLNMWLSRAAKRPLHLRMPYANYQFDLFSESRKSLVDLLERYSQQWQTLVMTPVMPPVLSSPICFPQLQKLDITAPQDLTAWKYTPSLRDVSIFRLSSSTVVLPWRQLTTLQCRGITATECLDLLRETSSLLELIIELERGGILLTTPSSLSLPRLRSLEIRRGSFQILPYITVPLLQILDLSSNISLRPDTVVGLLSRSRCQLTELVLDSDPSIRLLDELASLTSLWLGNTSLEALTLIFRRLNDSSFLPQLQNFTVTSCELEEFAPDTRDIDFPSPTQLLFADLANGLAMRWNPSAGRSRHMKAFKLVLHCSNNLDLFKTFQPNIVHRLKMLSAEGMDLRIQVRDQSWI